jgi:uncharacterized membrane protein
VRAMYLRFGAVLLISLGLMFTLSMSLVRTFDHFYLNPSNFYMSLMMVAAMGVVMLAGMWGMFESPRLNAALLAGFVLLFAAAFVLGRQQAFVGDEGFLRSMIPHHSRAILMCQEASIRDPEVVALCESIVETQRAEIAQMEAILARR